MTETARKPIFRDAGCAHRRRALAGSAALIALSAYAGALGLMTGFLSLGGNLNERLPFDSPSFGGVALAVVVALPSTSLTWLAWRGDLRTDAAAWLTGALLVGWILVEAAFIRDLSFLHPTYLAIGLVLMWIGRHSRHDLGSLLDRG